MPIALPSISRLHFAVRLRRTVGLLAGLAAASFGASACQAADTGQVAKLTYAVRLAGLPIANVQAQLILDGTGYQVGILATGDGLVGRLASFSTQIDASGSLTDAQPLPSPHRYRIQADFSGKRRQVDLTYDPAGPTAVTLEPIADPGIDPVPDPLRPGTIDPMSAMVAVITAIQRGGDCNAHLPVFDGRRRYDMLVADGGMAQLEPDSDALYAGQARRCSLKIRQIAGFKPQPPPKTQKIGNTTVRTAPSEAPPPVFWVAVPAADLPPLPVRIDIQSAIGTMVTELTAVDWVADRSADGSL